MYKTLGYLASFSAIAVCAFAAPSDEDKERQKAAERLTAATTVLSEMMNAGDKGVPRDLLERAQCVVVVPGLKKGAFIVGAEYGKGFMTCRKAAGWSAPAGITMTGGSFGLQAGGQETDLIMFAMSKTGAERWMGDQFTFGATASAAAGPVGRNISADTDAKLTAEILTWSRSHGVFAGVDLKGVTLKADHSENDVLYGHELGTKDVVNGSTTPTPEGRKLDAFLQMFPQERKNDKR